jgi:hyperosmotically inducible periplasmic protein
MITKHARRFGSVLALCVAMAACAPKDADIQADANKAVASMPGIAVTVASGIATITGQAADLSGKAAAESAVKAVKGVTGIVNQVTITPPPAPVVISADDSLKTNVAAALKDTPTLTASVQDGVVTLTGTVEKKALPKVMQALSALHPKKIDNKATVK